VDVLIFYLRLVMSERVEPSLQRIDVELMPVIEQVGHPRGRRSTLPVLAEVRGPAPAAQAPTQVLDRLEFEADRHLLDAQLVVSHTRYYALKSSSVPQSIPHSRRARSSRDGCERWLVSGALWQQEFRVVLRRECLRFGDEGSLGFLV